MIKDAMKFNESPNTNQWKMQLLKEYFPGCFNNEGKFDLAKFEKVIEDTIDVTREGYDLNFLGKSYSKLLPSLESETVLKPNIIHNSAKINASSKNIYISGDNLDVLKHLVNSYTESIRCIYIDPLYNTGSDDFIYTDDFNFTAEELSFKTGVPLEEAERILNMTKKGSASDSAWLTFMYPRLFLARDLLSKNGVIFISIDDHEYSNLKILCDDLFGYENFLGTIVWKNATDNNPSNVAVEHEYILSYCKERDILEPVWKSNLSNVKDMLIRIGDQFIEEYGTDPGRLQSEYSKWYRENKSYLGPLDRYKYIDGDGIYTGSQSVHNPGKEGYRYDVIHPATKKPCRQPLMGYRFPPETMQRLIEQQKILYGTDENKIVELKLYVQEYEDKLSSVFTLDGRLGAYDIAELFENRKVFTNPKPVELLKHLFSFVLSPNDIVLDFFSGSATTAQAVMELNITSNGQYHYILVQKPEQCKPSSEAYKAGYRTIDEVGIERIKRAATKVRNDTGVDVDYGFKLYSVVAPINKVLDKLEEFDPQSLVEDATILSDFGKETVLTTWAVQDGYGLQADIQEHSFDGYTVYQCNNTLYFLHEGLTTAAIKKLIEKYETDKAFVPNRLVLFGYSFGFSAMQELKDNVKQLQYSKSLSIEVYTRY